MRSSVGTAWVAEPVMEAMATEAERVFPCETGGVLLGYWALPFSEVVVTAAVGPGPGAVHEPTRFVPDADYQDSEIARLNALDPGRHAYLGDWHSHPHGGANLSPKDRKTLRQIATHQAARATVPLMAILTLDPNWRVAVWCFHPGPPWLRGLRARTSFFQTVSFAPADEVLSGSSSP